MSSCGKIGRHTLVLIVTPMILSKRCTYGIQAAIFVAAQSGKEYNQIAVIAKRLNISFHFLTKVLQQLTTAKLMTSYRGPNGGVLLARPAAEITLYDLIAAIDGVEVFTTCMLGLPGCGNSEPCPAHEHWIPVRNKFKQIAQSTTLATLAEKVEPMNLRVASLEPTIQDVFTS
jgi:Rrf2 family transcriptional regulator, iron-sulfur cluster assembly transcription factor